MAPSLPAQQKQTDQTLPKRAKSACHRAGKDFLLALLPRSSLAAPLPQALPVWIDAAIGHAAPPHPIANSADSSMHSASAFVVVQTPSSTSALSAPSLGLLFPLHATNPW
ncbi:hypothetical protein TMatcc_004299 [Talaromyces marneffei ATCC 18224]|uniref:uncharacterized protein n=1 Tax=Talaromyces marneffei TaxID=37727 RepID=UPI0012A90E13|nr:uncharacterized protein EYB26_000740 [Talaromyces marneffei]KAE8556888.1 hypothetical protein EYB25_001594 [Talaromyces marneffei]QGA13095.1 hypothetical protein EYB26_000740 [Talaromyces marneffei]